MNGDQPAVDGRDIFESELQDLVRKVWNEARKYGDTLCYAGVDQEVFLRGYDCDIHELLISYLDGPASDVGSQDEASEEGEMGDSVRSEGYLTQLMTEEPYEITISEDGRAIFKVWNRPPWVKKVVEQLDQESWYEGEIPEGWKKSPHATASDFFRQYSRQYRRP